MNQETAIFRSGVVSILMPVYNERAFLRRCMARVLEAPLPEGLAKEIVLVDDASTDGTDRIIAELAEAHPETIRPFRQSPNQGKGAAIRRAVEEMTGQFAIVQDADLEYDPADYPVLLQPILEGEADVVYGSRFASRTMRRVFNYHHHLGNTFLTHLSNMTTGLDLTDMETCYKAFRADILKTIPLRSDRFGMEPEITAKIAKRHCRVFEVPVGYRGRSYAEGKKIGWKDGVSAILTILRYWLIDDCYGPRYEHLLRQDLAHTRRLLQVAAGAIQPYLGDRILEVGAGLGAFSRQLPKRERLVVTDADRLARRLLRQAAAGSDVLEVGEFDPADPESPSVPGAGDFDTVVCHDTLERLEDDEAALHRMGRTLHAGGRLVLLVPAGSRLFGGLDEEAGHRRRYDRRALRSLLERTGFEVETIRNLGFAARVGWRLWSRTLGARRTPRWIRKGFDLVAPLSRTLERLLPLPGVLLLAVARARPEAAAANGSAPEKAT